MYEGDAGAITFMAARVTPPIIENATTRFDALLYPNPARAMAALQIKGDAGNITVSITDMSGKTVWQNRYTNRTQINLPVEKLSAGMYMITINNGTAGKIIKLVKE